MVVISLGGSIISQEEIDEEYIFEFRRFLERMGKKEKLYVVVGGGKTARRYIHAAQRIGMDQYTLDVIGILATRLNASLLLGRYSYPKVAKSIDEAYMAGKNYNIVIMGGTEPGHTTDAVSLLLAERAGEKRVINMTSVGGIFDKDPKTNEDAKLILRLSYGEAEKLFLNRKMNAGLNLPFDLLSLKIAERSGIEIVIIGKDLLSLEKVIKGEEFRGTVIGSPNFENGKKG